MKHFASLCAIVLAGSLPGLAASAHPTSVHAQAHSQAQFQNQFHFQPSKRHAAQAAAHHFVGGHSSALNRLHGPAAKTETPKVQSHLSPKNVRRHIGSNPPTGKVGFLAASQVTSGGSGTYWNAFSGDFNGDKIPDIVSEVEYWDSTSSSYLYAISIALSNGDGTFATPVLTTITDTCPSMLVADVNNDGKSDVIIGHQPNTCGNTNTQPTFDVWLSNGDGTLSLSSNTNNTIPVTGLAGGTLVDVNGDGKLDAVLVDDYAPGNVWTLLGNGDGTFQAPTSVALPAEAGYGTMVADVNGDGLLDIVDVDYNTYQVTVFLGTSTTSWASPTSYATPDSVYNECSLTLGDLNGDGLPEIVTTNCSYSGNDITVYVNNADGTFGTSGVGVYYDTAMSGGTNSGPAPIYADGATIADVNGDGKGDIIAANLYGSDVTVLFGNSDGTVTVPTNGFATGGYLWNIQSTEGPVLPLVADFNGDGFADIVLPDGIGSFSYLRGYGDGGFHSARDYYASASTYSGAYGIASGDFNGDGYPDLVVGNACGSCSNPLGITVFLSNPDGSLQSGITLGTSSTMWFAAVADFNGDGKLDIAATDYTAGTVTIFSGDGTGNFTAGTPINADLASNSPYGVFVGDFNNDGHPDLAIANYGAPDISILLNDSNGTGNFGAPLPTYLNGQAWEGVAVADLNNDGNLDLVVPYWYGSSVGVLLGDGTGNFTETDLTLPDTNGVAVADFNSDGKLDIAVTSLQGGGQDISIALGNGDGTFNAFVPVPSSLQDYTLNGGPDPEYIQTADVDGDGVADLVYTNAYYGTVGVLFGKGDGTFYDAVEYPAGEYAWGLVVADVNKDGSPDAGTGNDGNPGATVLLNNNGTGTLGTYTIQATGAQSISAGGAAKYTLTITPLKHYNGTVTLSCPTGLPALTSCSFSPSAVVTLDGLTPQTVTLTITTTAPSTSSMRLHSSVEPQSNPRPRSSAMMLASLNGIGVFGMFLAGNFNKKRIRSSMIGLLALGLLLFLVGCGGSSNTTTTPPPTKSSSTSAVTSSAATVLVGQPVTFTGTVSAASGTPTGTVTFLDGSTTLGTGTLSSGSATFQTTSLAAGVHPITISYGGDSNFNASTSSAFSQTVDKAGTPAGTYAVTVTGAGTQGTNGLASNPSIQVSVTVQ